MNRRNWSILVGASLGLLWPTTTWSQTTLMGADALSGVGSEMGYLGAAQQRVTDTGFRISDSSVLHLGIGAEAGYDSNVFFEPAETATASPILRVTPALQITNATRDGAIPSGVYFDLSASLQYREYITDDPDARAQRAFNPLVGALLEFSRGQTLSFALSDQFSRTEDPPYGPSQGNITRNYNVASAQLKLAPGGGRLAAVLRYTNALDFFENQDLRFANSMGHEFMFDGSWKWLPKTAIFLQAAQGMISYLDEDLATQNQKTSSYPLRLLAGLRGLITEKIAAQVAAGYVAGFYQGDAPNPSGLSNLATLVEVQYRPLLLTQILLGYRHEFRNSVIGAYYDLDTPYLSIQQTVAGRFVFAVLGRYERRAYQGFRPSDAGMEVARTDHFVLGGLQADYFLQRWFYLGVGYSLTFNDAVTDDPRYEIDYFKHLVTARVGITY